MRSISTLHAAVVGLFSLGILAGCDCNPKPTASSLALDPATATVVVGATQKLTATVTMSDGTTQDVTAQANWSSADQAIATVANSQTAKGTVTGKAAGVVKITATFSDETGKQVEGTTQITVDAAPKGTIVITPQAEVTTTEEGGTAMLAVTLSSAPTSDVTIAVSSSNVAEGTVTPASLVFTATNWNAVQAVTVTGVDDAKADGAQAYTVVFAAAVSDDPVFSGVDAADISVTNTDDDMAGFAVTPTTGLTTSEAGGTATFTVRLNSQPTSDVTVALSSSKPEEGTPSPATLVFTSVNWQAPQTVTVTGINDEFADGVQAYVIISAAAVSDDTSYSGLNPDDVAVSNTDNDTAGFTVTPLTGLVTTEAGGTATFTVVLNNQPTADVTVPVVSGDVTEGTVAPASLIFTPANWAAPRTVTVTGINDDMQDGNQPYAIVLGPATSADAAYNDLTPESVAVTNTDNDTAAFVVSQTNVTTSESGATATFTVALATAPTANVTITVTSSNLNEGTVSPASLTFTPVNWQAPQVVIVTGVNDATQDGNQTYSIVLGAATSTDTNYNTLNPPDVSASNTDNDTAAISVSPVSGLVTTESGGTGTFTVVLNSQPTATVTIAVSSSNVLEGTVSPATLTFTTANWNAPQTVTVTGVNDSAQDGNQLYTIVLAAATSTDTRYNGVNPADVSVSNTDNDSAGITVTAASGLTTTESGGTATFTVVLNSQPNANVTIAVSSSNTNEGTVAPATLTFTTANWNAPHTVTITGVNDNAQDGNQLYSVILATAASTDTHYAGIDPADISVTNTDNDTAGISVIPVSGLVTTEAGGTATFTVVLNTQPTATVTIALTSSNTLEGTVNPATLSFTTLNWNSPHIVTVSGVDDALEDGNQPYTITLAPAVSTDTTYNGINPLDVSVSNTDNDSADIVVTPTTGLVTTEAAGTATFTVALATQPTATVTVAVTSGNTAEGTVSPALLTFTTANWNAAQTVTVTGVEDAVQDGNQPYTIVLAAATSTDPNYSGRDATDVSVSNTDNDSAGITVNPTSGLVTTETGTTATFTVALNTQPTANVTIAVSSSNTAEGTVSTALLTFTAVNWNAAQTVTVTGVDDAVQDGNQSYAVVLAAAASTDTNYAGINPADVSVSNTDNDSAGVTVTPTSGLVTTEGGASATFTIALNSQPTADVVIALSSSNTNEGTVSPASLTFTSVNWAAAQTVTVTGVNDDSIDGNQAYTIITAAPTSTDTNYAGMTVADVAVSNTDNDTAGFVITALSNNVSESGTTATFNVSLNTRPTADVVVAVSSSDTTEGTVSPATLTFTALNWNALHTVTLTGINDDLADGTQSASVILGAAVSTDLDYNGLNPADVAFDTIDNDSAGVTISPASGLNTTEYGGVTLFTVVLNSQPTANVTVGLSSSNTAEGTVSPASVTFTSVNWNAPQIVTVSGVDDALKDGTQSYSIITAPAVSADVGYSGLNPVNVSLSNVDDDTPGITVFPITGRTTTEAGGTTTFQIVLNGTPTANVVIALSSSNTAEGTVAPASLTFTALNWNAPQTVTVTGVNDAVADGNQPYTIVTAAAVSADNGYSGLNTTDVAITNIDNDSAGITVNPTSGVVVTEIGGTDTFTIVLNSEPTGNVTVALSSSDTTEGTVSPASVTFTSVNWNAPQTVTVTGVNDAVQDGNQPFFIVTAQATSTDTNYSSIDPSNVAVSTTDDDSAGITVNPVGGLVVTEGATSDTFTVVLNSEPTANVVIALSSSDATEGSVSPSSLTFTALNWNAPQTVTVTGVDDAVQDGNQAFTIITAAATSTDVNYSGMNPTNVGVSNTDNDSAGITVTPVLGLVVTEAGTTDAFTIVLNSEPTDNVTIALTSSNTAEATVSPASVTFTALNWNAPQTVTVTGVNDFIQDGNQGFTITTAAATSLDGNYNGINPSNVTGSNTDNDTAGITVSAISGPTTEAGGTATFTVVLTSEPTANVAVGITSSDVTEGTISVATLTFTALNWNAPQTVTVTGIDDAVQDGNQPFTITTAAAVSVDGNYSGMNPANVAVTNNDNDTASISINPTSATTTEAGGTATFAVVLTSEPTGDVTIGLSSSDLTEGTVGPASLTFTALNWNAPQTVTVTGVNDAVQDGNQPYSIVTAAAVSTDGNYSAMNATDVTMSNTDNDSAGFTVAPTSGLVTTEGAGTSTFTVVLNSEPTADVTIALTSSDTTEATVGPASLTFTALNWNAPQTVTATGVNDAVQDGNQPFTIITAAAVSVDTTYNGMDPANVTGSNTDNDTAGITVNPVAGVITTEGGGTDTFTVVLNSEPTADVTIALASTDTTEGTIAISSLTFTALNWNAPQTVTVTGINDLVQDGNQGYTITTAAAVSADVNYSGMNAANVSVSNTDDDTAGFVISPAVGLTTSEAGGVTLFTVKLNSEPTATVVINLSSSDTTEGTVSPSSLTFTVLNWNTTQIVTVTGVDDAVQDGNQPYSIVTAGATSADGNYNGLNPVDVSLSNIDNDSPGVSITPTSGLVTTEAGGTATFNIVLVAQPTANVTFNLSSSDLTEGSVLPATVTFTTVNWNTPQTITVTGVDDFIVDGNQSYNIVTDSVTSADLGYNGLDPSNVSCSNTDND